MRPQIFLSISLVLGLATSLPAQVGVARQDYGAPVDARAVVESWYQKFFGRAADPDGLRTWTESLVSGNPPALTLATMLCGDEYYRRQGRTPEAFVTGLYRDLYGRAPTFGELQGATQDLVASGNSDQDRLDVAYRIIRRAQRGGGVAWMAAKPPAPPPEVVVQEFGDLGCRIRWNDRGGKVLAVAAGGLGDRMGLAAGDTIWGIDGRGVRSHEELREAFARSADRQNHFISMVRNDQTLLAYFRVVFNRVTVVQPFGPPQAAPVEVLGCHLEYGLGGVRVREVLPGTIAAQVGLRAGDMIFSIGGRPVRTPEQVHEALERRGRDRFRIDLYRHDKEYKGQLGFQGNRLTVREPVRIED